MSNLDDIATWRGNITIGGLPLQWVELMDGECVPFEIHEPDANTYHEGFYYNTRENVLYQKVKTSETPCDSRQSYFWKRISERR